MGTMMYQSSESAIKVPLSDFIQNMPQKVITTFEKFSLFQVPMNILNFKIYSKITVWNTLIEFGKFEVRNCFKGKNI